MKLSTKINKLTAKLLTFFTVLALGAVIAPSAMADVDTPWGPERDTFTWEDPAPYATFNSITNNPDIGDERNFVRVREVKDGEKYGDSVSLEVGKTYEVYIYYHNNADAHDVGTSPIGIAENVMMKSSFPATVKAGEQATVSATISTSNASPRAVWDGAYLNSSRDVYLRYVPGTAIIHNGGELNGQDIGPTYLFGDGALLGYNTFSGILPGCNQYAGYVTYQFFVDAPDFTVTKSIISGSDIVRAGDEVTFKVRYANTGTMDQKDVVVKDILPANLEYLPGSTILYNNNFTDGKTVNDDLVTDQGINIGDYAGGDGWAEIVYKVKVLSAVKCNDRLKNSVTVSTTDGNKSAEAILRITADGCTVTPDPETPSSLPNTGPAEIVTASIIVLVIVGAGIYLWRTRFAVKSVENKVSGKSSEKRTKTSDNLTSAPENHASSSEKHATSPENHTPASSSENSANNREDSTPPSAS